MKKFTFPLFLAISLLMFVPVYAAEPPAAPGREPLPLPKSDIVECGTPGAVTQCNDGMCSTSTGSGTCSSHGGVAGSLGSDGNFSEPESESRPIQLDSEGRRPGYTLAPLVPESAAPSPTFNQPAPASVQIPASGGILASQSTLPRVASGLSILLLMIGAAIRAIGKK
jgi:hypothetical protein